MFDVTIDLQKFASNLPEETVQDILENVADSARNHWIALAGQEFKTTSRDYISGIQKVEMHKGMAVISLVGVLPNLLENGMPETDLRDTLLGPNVPVAAPGSRGKRLTIRPDGTVGYYRSIPFRHSVPGASGTIAPPMGSAYEGHPLVSDYRKLGESVYAQAKKLKASTSQPGSGVAYGGRLPAGLAPKLKPIHKTDIYASMIREQKTYQSATQGQYATFRTISTLVKDGSWIRPATSGRRISEEVGNFVSQLAPKAFEAYVSGQS